MTEYTHIRISKNTQNHLKEFRAPGQSYDGLLRELLWLAYKHPLRRVNPALPGDEHIVERISAHGKIEKIKATEMKVEKISYKDADFKRG